MSLNLSYDWILGEFYQGLSEVYSENYNELTQVAI